MDDARRFGLGPRTLREHAARGTLINTGFVVGLSVLGFLRALVLAALLTRSDYGVWGVLSVTLGTLLWLKDVGIGDKFVQQDETDQELAFQRAFTLEIAATGVAVAVLTALLPLICAVYGEWELLAPGLVIVLLLVPARVLRAPLWVFYRRMDFVRQRALQSVEPVVALIASVGLAVAGFGYWAPILGLMAGAWALAAAAAWQSPYRLRLRYDTGTLRSYWTFSWPLFVAAAAGIASAQAAVLLTDVHLGLAGVGALMLASQVTVLTHRVDELVTGTLYPAVVAVRHRLDLLAESFVKSNRLALIFAMPFGFGVALFGGDLVTYVLGERWRPAVELLQIYGLVAGVGHVAFNWDAYLRALGHTRPVATAAAASAVAFLAAVVPLLALYELRGLALAVGLQTAVHVACRVFYMRRLFPGFRYLSHAARSMLPTVSAVAVVILMRHCAPWERGSLAVVLEATVYVGAAALATWLLEKQLLREALRYLRPQRPAAE